MKKILLLAAACLFTGVYASAQTWTAPEPAEAAQEIISGNEYLVRNVAASKYNQTGMFLSGGSSWYSWSTSTVVVSADQHPLHFILTEVAGKGWTFTRTTDNKYTFISGPNPAGMDVEPEDFRGEMHVDQGSQAENLHYFNIVNHGGGIFGIQAAEINGDGGANAYYNPEKWWGWDLTEESQFPNAVYATVPADPHRFGIDWEFVTPEAMAVYEAKVTLYNMLTSQEIEDYSIDTTEAGAVYTTSNDVDELNAAIEQLKKAIKAAEAYAILDGASEADPKDGTSLLVNPDFGFGNIDGWVCTFVSGTTAQNIGYQGANYVNGDVRIEGFIEAWVPNDAKYKRDGRSYATIGDAELKQTLYSLPAGKYLLTADVNAVQQHDGSVNPVTGVQLYATDLAEGGIDNYKNVATGNGAPEHFELTFYSTGGDVELGLRTRNSTANWIAADNFTLTYYGEVTVDPLKAKLDAFIEECEAAITDVNYLECETAVAEAYTEALDAAKAATSDYATAQDNLNTALEALNNSIAMYKNAKNQINNIDATITKANNSGWDSLGDDLADYKDGLSSKYDEGTLTSEDVAGINAAVNGLIADYVSEHCLPGDDVTILLQNPNFDTDFSGWNRSENCGTVNYGGKKKNPDGILDGLANQEELEAYRETGLPGGNAEVYHGVFDIFQTIHNMPRGLYELSCKAFERDENGAVDAELYAILPDGSTQTVKVMEINEDLSENAIYTYGSETPDGNNSRNMGAGWAPDGMSSANWHFAAGFYKNYFNILLTEPGDITIGIRSTSASDWVLFDDFKLVYKGSGASAYADAIKQKVEKLVKVLDNPVTIEVSDNANQAIEDAENALAENDEDACLAALDALDKAYEAAIKSTQAINELSEQYSTYAEYLINEVDSDDEEFGNLLEHVGGKLDDQDFQSDKEVEGYKTSLRAGWTHFVMSPYMAEASEEDPADVSAVIINRNGIHPITQENSWAYWSEAAGLDGISFEMFDKTYDFNQTINGLEAGYYRLYVNGFYRNGDHAVVAGAMNGETEEVTIPETDENGDPVLDEEGNPVTTTTTKPMENLPLAKLYAGKTMTNLLLITDDLVAYNDNFTEGATETIEGVSMLMPDNMAQASSAFSMGLYENCLQFEVIEKGDVTIGICKAEAKTHDWTIFTNWRLEYLGTSTPSENITTEIISGVQTGAINTVTRIYGADGQLKGRLSKGVNILKSTLSDGTVRVQKILVR